MQIKTKKYFLKNGFFDVPQHLQIEITDECPLKCPQCYKTDKEYKYMSWDVFKDIIDQAVSCGIENIYYNGGEPLIHPQICDFIEYVNNTGIKQMMFTSGAGLTREKLDSIYSKNVSVNLSFNGSNNEINSRSRDGFDISLHASKEMRNCGIKFQINWVARHDNVYDLNNMIVFGKEIGASAINIVCNKLTAFGEIVSPLTYNDYMYIKEMINENEDYLGVQNCYGILLSLLGVPKNKLYGCQAGIRVMAVTCDGYFMPCTHLYYPEKFQGIMEYWKHSDILSKLRKIDVLEYCDDCEACRVCHSISKESHEDFNVGYKECPVRMYNLKKKENLSYE